MKNAATWSYRLLGVYDLDSSGVIDRGEFNALYDCVPGVSSTGARLAWETHSKEGGVDPEALQRFLQAAFAGKSQEEFESAMMAMMERGSLIASATLAHQSPSLARSPSPGRDHVAIDISPGRVKPLENPSPVENRSGMSRMLPDPIQEVSVTINPMLQQQQQQQSRVTKTPGALSMTPPPPSNAGMPEACTPELLKKIDELIPSLFHRYDADCSGTLNTKAELQQLTINLTFNLGLRIRPDVLQGLVKETELGSWTPQEFRKWYTQTTLKLLPPKKGSPIKR